MAPRTDEKKWGTISFFTQNQFRIFLSCKSEEKYLLPVAVLHLQHSVAREREIKRFISRTEVLDEAIFPIFVCPILHHFN